MAKDLFFKCIDDAITRLHYIDFVMLPYINKLKSNENYDENYCDEIACLRKWATTRCVKNQEQTTKLQ